MKYIELGAIARELGQAASLMYGQFTKLHVTCERYVHYLVKLDDLAIILHTVSVAAMNITS